MCSYIIRPLAKQVKNRRKNRIHCFVFGEVLTMELLLPLENLMTCSSAWPNWIVK